MVTIAGREIVYSQSLIVGDGQPVEIQATAKGHLVPVRLIFSTAPNANPNEATTTWRTEGGVLIIDFVGWRNPLGICIGPQRLGDIGGNALGFQVAGYRINDQNFVHFYLLFGGAYG